MKLVVLVSLLVLVGIAVWLITRANVGPSPAPTKVYARQEDEATSAFYTPYAEFMEATPADIAAFVQQLEIRTGLLRSDVIFPSSQEALAGAASAFVAAASEVFDFELSLDAEDAGQIDRFANMCLIDPVLRGFLGPDGWTEDMPEEDVERLAKALDTSKIPNEPLLYYAMGSFWGEWLVRHRHAAWRLYDPLQPIQAFPDMITTATTICMQPFSQVTKKLSDPVGDNLAFKAKVTGAMRRCFPPYLLVASIADAEQAESSLLPPEILEAWQLANHGNHADAVAAFDAYLDPGVDDPRLFYLAIPSAWESQNWRLVEVWSLRALELAPRHPVLNHNLAVMYSQIPEARDDAIKMLQTALAEDPGYGRAHLTLASVLLDAGRREEALDHVEWIVEHDPGLREEAERLREEISGAANEVPQDAEPGSEDPNISVGDLHVTTETESRQRASVLPTSGSEDASVMLGEIAVSGCEEREAPLEYLPDATTEWIVHANLGAALGASDVASRFGKEWRERFGGLMIYGRDAATGRWTFLVSSDGPEAVDALQFAWAYYASWADDGVTDIEMYRARVSAVGDGLREITGRSVEVGVKVSPADAHRRSEHLSTVHERYDRTVAVRLAAPKGSHYDGRAIWDVLLSLGLEWGDMDLFHWRNSSGCGDDSFFSVWTSTPPGYFLPESIAAGDVMVEDLVFGYSIPRSADPVAVFDSMIRAVEYAQRRLAGEITAEDGGPLDRGATRKAVAGIASELESLGFAPGSGNALRQF